MEKHPVNRWYRRRFAIDACIYPLLIPVNAFAMTSMLQLANMSFVLHNDVLFGADCEALASKVGMALWKYALMRED